MIPNAQNFDIIVITSQEVPRSCKKQRFQDLLNFFEPKGFLNIDDTFCNMWEMFLIVFVKSYLRPEITCIRKETIAKGKMGLIGNKGIVAYSFVLRDRTFNFIGCHLKHGQDKA